MQKILVIGSPGAGKSTFARKLRDRTGLPLYYLDLLYHNPDRTTVSREIFDRKLLDILRQDRWILDGNYQRTIAMRLQYCDTVFLLDYPAEICLAGAEARVGIVREEMPWTEKELDPAFRQAILDYPHKQMPEVCRLLDAYRTDREIVIFKSRAEANAYV